MIFEGDRHEIDRYLQAVDEIQRSMKSAMIAEEHNKANSAIQIAMARLEDEFRNILIAHTSPIEIESIGDYKLHDKDGVGRRCCRWWWPSVVVHCLGWLLLLLSTVKISIPFCLFKNSAPAMAAERDRRRNQSTMEDRCRNQ
ncbi:hypothetical protein F0562_027520 [Nyssa sinensis]|uniref:Uncharacterized protein n=1 Tax=Nyssa sinensis TaxID=561372 RepID=A0A5J5B5L6_9ASTE|nr:hypothetical protein F0562_027520 [Nyssa sinensis]